MGASRDECEGYALLIVGFAALGLALFLFLGLLWRLPYGLEAVLATLLNKLCTAPTRFDVRLDRVPELFPSSWFTLLALLTRSPLCSSFSFACSSSLSRLGLVKRRGGAPT